MFHESKRQWSIMVITSCCSISSEEIRLTIWLRSSGRMSLTVKHVSLPTYCRKEAERTCSWCIVNQNLPNLNWRLSDDNYSILSDKVQGGQYSVSALKAQNFNQCTAGWFSSCCLCNVFFVQVQRFAWYSRYPEKEFSDKGDRRLLGGQIFNFRMQIVA